MPALSAAARAYDQAYQQMRLSQAEKARLDIEKAQLDIQEKRRQTEMESPSGRAAMAGDIAATLEQMRQKEEGIQISPEIARRTLEKGGPSILAATQMQGELDVESKIKQARREALTGFLTGEKSLIPTARVEAAGVSQTVPASMAGDTSAQIQENVYNATWPRLATGYVSMGYDKQTAESLAKKEAMQNAFKTEKSGKITILSIDGSTTKTYSDAEAKSALQDPDTPEAIKQQLRVFIGPEKRSTASSWVTKSLGR